MFHVLRKESVGGKFQKITWSTSPLHQNTQDRSLLITEKNPTNSNIRNKKRMSTAFRQKKKYHKGKSEEQNRFPPDLLQTTLCSHPKFILISVCKYYESLPYLILLFELYHSFQGFQVIYHIICKYSFHTSFATVMLLTSFCDVFKHECM